MGDDELPTRIKIRLVVIVILFLALLIPYIVCSAGATIQYVGEQPVRPLTIDQMITHYADKYNVDEKLARDIIYCESRFVPDALNKKAVVGEDVGLFQLNSYYWQDNMALNGWNIYNIEDNIEAGMWLLSISGSDPWLWSKFCWSVR